MQVDSFHHYELHAKARRVVRSAALMSALALLTWAVACKSSAQKPGTAQGQRGPMVVSVATAPVEERDVPVVLSGLGSVAASDTVTVKSRLDGQLVQVAFREGQQVRKGQLLAVVDPRPYQVALSQAQATLFRDRAALQDAKINNDRYAGLYKEGVISKQQFDTQHATMDQLEGAVRADQALVDNAKLNLTYTRITAPVDGRIGLRLVDVGNMVHASDQNGLLVITRMQPINVLFTLPQDQLPAVVKQMKGGTLPVDAYSRDDQTRIAAGKLLTIDNQIDPTTGTARLKAVFDNRDSVLWPNQFVNVHLLLETRKDNVVVPAAAIQRGPNGTYAYVVKPGNTVELRPVQVSLTQGTIAAISAGLKVGDVVVTDGQDKLQTGSRIEPRTTGTSAQRTQTAEAVRK